MTAKKASSINAQRRRRETRSPAAKGADQAPATSKTDVLLRLLQQPKGASIAEMVKATGWQAHSVRGALAGSLRKKGHSVTSDKSGGERRYRIGKA